MVVGLVPLLFASGAGANSRFSLGLVIVVGMLIGTFFTLLVLPTMYTFFARDHRATGQSARAEELAAIDAAISPVIAHNTAQSHA
jgi:multidrug efflux pump